MKVSVLVTLSDTVPLRPIALSVVVYASPDQLSPGASARSMPWYCEEHRAVSFHVDDFNVAAFVG